VKGNIGAAGTPESGVHRRFLAFIDLSLAGDAVMGLRYCELTADPFGADFGKELNERQTKIVEVLKRTRCGTWC
jgi:hypothetical protein